MAYINIEGKDKVKVLLALYDYACVFLGKSIDSSEETESYIKECFNENKYYFHELKGTTMRVNLLKDEFDPSFYDAIYGLDTAEKVIKKA